MYLQIRKINDTATRIYIAKHREGVELRICKHWWQEISIYNHCDAQLLA